MEQIKNCAICGSEPKFDSAPIKGYEPDVGVSIKCGKCKYPKGGRGDTVYSKNFDEAYNKAVKEWNEEMNKIEGFIASKNGPVKRTHN